MTEVLCFKSDDVDRVVTERGSGGFSRQVQGLLDLKPHWVQRDRAERDRSYRQIIPYVVLTSGRLTVVYRRTVLSSEARLHGKLSLGFGGHIEPIDAMGDLAIDRTIAMAARREVLEEVKIGEIRPGSVTISQVGAIANDKGVGRYHLAIVQRWDFSDWVSIDTREPGLTECAFLNHEGLQRLQGQMESWARTCTKLLLTDQFEVKC